VILVAQDLAPADMLHLKIVRTSTWRVRHGTRRTDLAHGDPRAQLGLPAVVGATTRAR